MAAVDDTTIDDWADRVSTASTWVGGGQGRKLTALADEIRAAKDTVPAMPPPPPPDLTKPDPFAAG